MSCATSVLVAVSFVATTQDLAEPAARQGYYVAAGIQSVVSRNTDEDVGTLAPLYGGAASLRAGQMVTPWLGFGLQLELGTASSHRWRQQHGGLMLAGQLVPWRHLGVHAGAGWGFVLAEDKEDRFEDGVGVGGAYFSVGLSYDFFPSYERGSGGWAVTPSAALKSVPSGGFDAWMVWVGVDVVWWLGLDDNQLALSVDEAYVR